MMKKAILAIVLVGLVAMPMMSAMAGKGGKAGNSDIVHLHLYTEAGDNYAPDNPEMYADACGRIKYNLDGNLEFVFNGHNLVAGETYELRSGGDTIGEPAVANGGGNVHIQASLDITAADLGNKINLWVLSENGDSRVMRALTIK